MSVWVFINTMIDIAKLDVDIEYITVTNETNRFIIDTFS